MTIEERVRANVEASRVVRRARERAVILRGPVGDYLREKIRADYERRMDAELERLFGVTPPTT